MGKTSPLLRRDRWGARHHSTAVSIVLGATITMLASAPVGAAESASPPVNPPASPAAKPLDLRVPDITEILTPEELQQLLARLGTDEREVDEVKVERPSQLPLAKPVWAGLMAPFWALANPSQAWRIFAPLPADQVNAKGR